MKQFYFSSFTLLLFLKTVFAQSNLSVNEIHLKKSSEYFYNEISKTTGMSEEEISLFFDYHKDELHKDKMQFIELIKNNPQAENTLNEHTQQLVTKYLILHNKHQWQKSHKPHSPIYYKHNTLPIPANQPCTNIDFENGTTSGWTCYTGANSGSNADISYMTMGNCSAPRHTITSGNGYDPIVGSTLPLVAPNGSYSLRLGNSNTGAEMDAISQTFVVDSSNANFTYYYAVVFEDPNHTTNEQPFFAVKMYDVTNGNTEINCAKYVVKAGSGIPGFQNGPGSVKYKTWTPVFIPLYDYMGKEVRVDFISGDCIQGGHFGYAYIDASCLSGGIRLSANVICGGGNMNISAPSGASSYIWNTGDTTEQITIYSAGTYSVTMTTPSNCDTVTLSTTIDSDPGVISASFSHTATCIGDTTYFNDLSTFTGGSIISRKWDFGIAGSNADTSNLTNPYFIYNSPGTYLVKLLVESNVGCVADTTIPVVIHEKPILSHTLNNPTCYGLCNGKIYLSVAGGISPYAYQWSNGNVTQNIFNLCDGNYFVTATDSAGCYEHLLIEVVSPQTVNISIDSVSNVSCLGQNTGHASFSGTGGPPPYYFNWSNGYTTSYSTNLTAGNYAITITDSLGCKDDTTFVISNPDGISFSYSVKNSSCGKNDGYISIDTITGNNAPYSFSWGAGTNGQTNSTATGLVNGIYCLTITGNNQCDTSICISVGYIPPPTLYLTVVNPTCFDSCNGNASVYATGGSSPGYYNYSFSNGDTSSYTDKLCSGNYSVSVSDTNNCISSENFIISAPTQLSFNIITTDDDSGNCSGSAKIVVYGGSPPYTFLWSNGNTNEFADSLCYGNYDVTIRDSLGCIETTSISIGTLINVLQTKKESEVMIYPNPSEGEFIISINSPSTEELELIIYNALSQKVFSTTLPVISESIYIKTINLSSNSSGIYYLQITGNNISTIKQIILE
jgi:hypothetical protein